LRTAWAERTSPDGERKFRDQLDIEVVVLGAESREALGRTHSRAFKDVRELAQEALDKVLGLISPPAGQVLLTADVPGRVGPASVPVPQG
jgi:hypothetical protein